MLATTETIFSVGNNVDADPVCGGNLWLRNASQATSVNFQDQAIKGWVNIASSSSCFGLLVFVDCLPNYEEELDARG